jgi:hypothetical protein
MSGATSPEAETIIRQTQQINTLMGQSASQIERVQRQLDGAYAAQQRFAQAQASITAAVERGRITQERANQLLELNKQRLDASTVAAQRFNSANDNAARSVRGSGQVIQQAGFQLQDFFVQVQGGTSALTALSQQGSQFLGLFGAGGAIAGAALAIGAVAFSLLGMGDNGAAAAKKIEDGFRASQRAGEDLTRVIRELSAELLTAGERAANLANAQRQALVVEGRTHMMRLENERTAAGDQQYSAQRALDRVSAARRRLEADLAAASPRNRGSIESDLRESRNAEFEAQSRLDAARRTQDETTRRIGELRALTDRAENVRTGPEQFGPGSDDEIRRREEAARAAARAGRAGAAAARRDQRIDDRERRETDRLIASLDGEAAANIRLRDSLEQIAEARRRGFILEDQAADLSARARQRADEDRQRAQQRLVMENDKSELYAEETKRVAELTRELGDIMGDTFRSLVREGDSFADVLDNIQERLLRLGDKLLLQPLLEQIAQLAMAGLGGGGTGGLGGILGSLIGGGATAEVGGALGGAAAGVLKSTTSTMLFHDGGVVGGGGRLGPVVPAEVFLDAPRYHTGGFAGRMPFANDEVPAILRRGEVVLTERQQQSVARGSGGVVINQTIKTEDPGAFGRTRSQIANATRREIGRASRSA